MAITKQGYESDDSIEEQIRSAAEERSAGKAAPIMEMDEVGTEGKRTSMAVGPAAKRTPMVTKEQLAASGLSLRDYLNKQQGLTRRGDSGTSTTSSKKESSEYRSEGKNKPIPSNDLNMPVNERIKKSLENARKGSGPTDSRSANQRIKEALGMKKGGSVKKMASGGSVSSASKRADGIATKGKTRGRMC